MKDSKQTKKLHHCVLNLPLPHTPLNSKKQTLNRNSSGPIAHQSSHSLSSLSTTTTINVLPPTLSLAKLLSSATPIIVIILVITKPFTIVSPVSHVQT
jgi:hypothetical protein